MNRLGSNQFSKRIFDAVRSSVAASWKPPISKTRLYSAVRGGEGREGEEDEGPPILNRDRAPRMDRRPVSREDEAFLERFKLGEVDSGGKAEEPPLESETEPSPPEDHDEIFRKMKETGLIPNAVAMLDGLCKDGLVQDAMKLFAKMRERGTIPEVVVYTAVVEAFCKSGKPDDAVRIFRKMQSSKVVPNAFSYNLIVQGLCRCKRSEESLGFCVEMLEAGHSPNVGSFVRLVQGLCDEKGVEETREAIGKLRGKGFVINEKAVQAFLDKKADFSPTLWDVIFGNKSSPEEAKKTFDF